MSDMILSATIPGFRTARDKILSVEEMAAVAAAERIKGRRVVLCHGVFDLLHMGHVRHLEGARREGDLLCVTLTADKYVNKGPGRPIFGERLRAEMLAAVEYVDWVAVNYGPSAEPVLDTVQPDVYVKGSDYENPDEDITGKINSERDSVERHGGRIVFTKDITFSSSNLINRYLDVYDPPLRDLLDRLRAENGLPDMLGAIDAIADKRVLFVGDTIIDHYKYVTPLGKAAKENIITTLFGEEELFAGGVIAAANHTADFCAQVDVITALGEEDDCEELIRRSLKPRVNLHVVRVPKRPTTRKQRFVEKGYMRKLFEVYFMDDSPFPAEVTAQLFKLVGELAPAADCVVATDFGHGLISPAIIAEMTAKARFLAVNAQTNSGNQGYNLITKYGRADYICIDQMEAHLAVADKFSDVATIASEILPQRVASDRVIVTCGRNGCVSFQRDIGAQLIPSFTKTVVDTVGAGDAFLAVTAPLAAVGARMDHVGFIGNAAGAMKVGIVGHRASVEKVPLLKFITTLLK